MDDVSQSDTSDSETQTTMTSHSSRRHSICEQTQQSLAALPATANRLYQETKEQIEQIENMETAIKGKFLENLSAMYEIVLRLSESRQTLQIQLEKARANTTEQVLAKEQEYAGRLVELAEGVKSLDVRPSVNEILTEVKSLRQIIVFDVLDQMSNNQQQQLPHAAEFTKQLHESTKKLTEIIEETKKNVSYAEIAARPAEKVFSQQPKHSIIISSKIEKDSSEDVLNKIREAANARVSGVKVEQIRKAKNKKVVISCSSKNSLNDIKEKLKTNDNLKIDDAKNKDPLIIIKNVLTYNTDEDIQTSLRTQNTDALKHINDNEYRATVKYRRKARNPHECHVVLQVSPKVWQALTKIERVHIDLQRCQVFDQSPLVQCTRCLGFGHGRKTCKETVDRCSHCAGQHMRTDCPTWQIGDIPCCRNCHTAKLENTGHSAFDRECPIRIRWDAIARSSVSYC